MSAGHDPSLQAVRLYDIQARPFFWCISLAALVEPKDVESSETGSLSLCHVGGKPGGPRFCVGLIGKVSAKIASISFLGHAKLARIDEDRYTQAHKARG